MQGFVELPSQLQVFITGAVIGAVGLAFAWLFKQWPGLESFLGQYVDEVAVTISAAVVGLIQNALNLIPPQWEAAGSAFLAFVVAVLVVLQVIQGFKKSRNTFNAWRSR